MYILYNHWLKAIKRHFILMYNDLTLFDALLLCVYTLAVLAIKSSSEANVLCCRNNCACETQCVRQSHTSFNETLRQINSPKDFYESNYLRQPRNGVDTELGSLQILQSKEKRVYHIYPVIKLFLGETFYP